MNKNNDQTYIKKSSLINSYLNIHKYKNINDILSIFYVNIFPLLKKYKKIPVVTIMGHVNHGKTTLLDFIRSSHITDNEQGGITQKIGAYYVNTSKGKITFIDTPGHEIFNIMRIRGFNISDITIIIISATEGIQEQTIEVLNEALNNNLPIIIAITKIELSNQLSIKKIINDLIKFKIISTEKGGNTFIIPISSKTGVGISDLLETILLKRDMLNLQVSYEGMVIATVIESKLNKQMGPIATILIENGTLKKGDLFICGNSLGKIKCIKDEYNNNINLGYPSIPIKVLGLSKPPMVGEKLITIDNEKIAKKIIDLQNKFQIQENDDYQVGNFFLSKIKTINLIIKSDDKGTLEVITNYFDSLNKKYSDKIFFKILYSNIGDINESDIKLSINTSSKIIGFNVSINKYINNMIRFKKIQYQIYNIISDLMNDIYNMYLLDIKETNDNIMGIAIIKNIFYDIKNTKKNIILGCKIIFGTFKKNIFIKIYREEQEIFSGNLTSLRRYKEEIKEISYPLECGMCINNVQNIKTGDKIKCFKLNIENKKIE